MNLSINKVGSYVNGILASSDNMASSWPAYVTPNVIQTTSDAVNLTNATDFTEEPPTIPSTWFIIVSTVALGILVLLVIFGNILVLLAVALERSLRTVTHYFIVNLAVADLLLGTTVLPFSATYEIIPYWPFGPTFCDIWAAVDVLCCTASINSLCVISIDRYIGVTRPLQHNLIMTKKRAYIIIAVVWLFSVAISAGPLFGWREPTKDAHNCPLTESLDYVLFSVTGSFYIPLIIILVLYYRIYREAIIQTRFLMAGEKTGKGKNDVTLRVHTAQQKMKNKQGSNPDTGSPTLKNKGRSLSTNLASKLQRFNKEKKAAKTLGIVVGVFIGCWLPFFLLLPLQSICGPPCYPPDMVFKVVFWLGYCNSCLNPIIYAMSNRYFKRAFKRILTCRFGRRRQRNRNHYLRSSGKQLIKYQNSLNGSHAKGHRHYTRKNMSIASTSGYELTEVSMMNASPSVSHSSVNSKCGQAIHEEYEGQELREDMVKENLNKQSNYVNLNVTDADENCNSETDKLLIVDSKTSKNDTNISCNGKSQSDDSSLSHQNIYTANKISSSHQNEDTSSDVIPNHEKEDSCFQKENVLNNVSLNKQIEADDLTIPIRDGNDYTPNVLEQSGVCSKCHRTLTDKNVHDVAVADGSGKVTPPESMLLDKGEIPSASKTIPTLDVTPADAALPIAQPPMWERLSSPESETTDPNSSEDLLSRSRESIFSLQIIEEGDVPLTVPSRQDVRSKMRRRKRNIQMKETKLTNSGVQTGDSLMSLEFLQECLEKKTAYKKMSSESHTKTDNADKLPKRVTGHEVNEATLGTDGSSPQSS